MSLQDLLPAVESLPRADKERLREWLNQELEKAQSIEALLPPGLYPLSSPEPAYDAAERMMQFLEEERKKVSAPPVSP